MFRMMLIGGWVGFILEVVFVKYVDVLVGVLGGGGDRCWDVSWV
jgi:hypothetical protein